MLPAPSIGSASPAPSLQDLNPNHDFDSLNKEILEKGPSSKRVQQTFSQVQRLIERGNITELYVLVFLLAKQTNSYKFPHSSKFKTAPKISNSSNPSASFNQPALAPFSKMVYNQSAVPFRYPTPETPSITPTPNGQPEAPARVPEKQSSPSAPKLSPSTPALNAQKNKQAHAHNVARLEIVLPTKSQLEQAAAGFKPSPSLGPSAASLSPKLSQAQAQKATPPNLVSPKPDAIEDSITVTPVRTTPQAAPSSQQKAAIAVELTRVPFDKSQFLPVSVPDEFEEPTNLSIKKRKRSDLDGDDIYGESLDLRQRADTAFRDLRVFLQGVFEAEEMALRSQISNDSVMLINEKEATLTSASQSKAQTLLGKAISLNCFQNAPLDDLLRLFRLSEGALRHSESLDIKIEESWTRGDVEQWVEQLPALETAIRAARTSLRMMCGGRNDKQLYSEDVIDQSLNLFKRVVDGVIMPVAEMRTTGNTADLFKDLSSYKKKIVTLFTDVQKLFSVMSTLISKIDTSDTVSNTLEFIASKLIFIETAHAERESVIDTQKFDGLRLVAMDMLSQIFLLNPAQRRGIFDEILTSLEKLPLGKRARTFKLVDGTSIQPVSALMMRLVQTSAGQVKDGKLKGNSVVLADDDEEMPIVSKVASYSIRDENHGAAQHKTAIQELHGLADPLDETARGNAMYVVNYIVNRALKSTKSGDTPYRNLLDLFVEDFTSCLDNPDWPGAALLLELLTGMMLNLTDEKNKASTVTAKNMALELLGIIGAAISKLRAHVRKTANALDSRDDDDLGRFLSDLASAALEYSYRPENMFAWTGPYRATLEYLESRFSEDQHLASAITFLVSDWSNKVCGQYEQYDKLGDDMDERGPEFGRLAYRLREMIQDRRWLSNEFSFKEVSPNQAKLAYAVTLLGSKLCKSFDTILGILLNSTGSDQPTVRSKSLKSINQVLDTDPSILDSENSAVIRLIVRCTNDPSTQVRDSALGLIGKCIGMRPKLEDKMVGMVVERFTDTGLGVRKRAMKLAKDIYVRNHNKAVKSAIANGLLHRVQDPEESVRDLARQIVEEIWFSPFYSGENSAEIQTSVADHVALMIQTVNQGNVTNVLDKVLQGLIASKTSHASLEVCRKLVSSMFDLVDNPDSNDPTIPSGRKALQVLMIFSKAEPSLFTFEQLRLLMPHIMSIQSNEDLAVSRAVVVIYRRVLPQLSSAHGQFLQEVRKHLQPALSKVTRALLDDIIACLWIISTLLKDYQSIAMLTGSSLAGILKMDPKVPLERTPSRQFERYSLIIGMIGKHCDLDKEEDKIKERIKQGAPRWKGGGSNVSEVMVQAVLPFAAPSQSLEVRKAALDSVGLVCQSWPRNYTSPRVYTTFQQVFDSEVAVLETMVLRSFKEFLFTEEKRSEQASEKTSINGTKPEKKRELTVMGGTNYDDVASGTARRFLAPIIRIAKATQDEHAYLAVEVLASINRQGLTHPKETGVTFITLETSTNPRISELAYLEHKALHAKHETVIEREYPSALKEVYAYQRDIVKDPRGAIAESFVPKLHLMMEVLKISKSKNRQKFLEKLCNQIDFDLSKLEKQDERTQHVQYACFLADNLAFFEYLTVGEVHSTVAIIEKLVTSTGANVAQAVESEVFQVRMDAIGGDPVTNTAPGDAPTEIQPAPPKPEISLKRLQQFTAASMILLILWEVRTHLRRLYGMGTGRQPKTKDKSKDLSKAPVKVPSVTGDKVWEETTKIMTSLDSRQLMMEACKAFVELMNVDKEFMIQDDDDMNGEEPTTPGNEEDDDDDERPSAGRGRKRKAGGTTPGGRKKRARSTSQLRKRGRPRKQSIEVDADGEMEEEWF